MVLDVMIEPLYVPLFGDVISPLLVPVLGLVVDPAVTVPVVPT